MPAAEPVTSIPLKTPVDKKPVVSTGSQVSEFNDQHESIEVWQRYFTGRGRKVMRRYLERSGRYVPMMKKIFKQYNLPDDLVYVAMIESGFSSRAVSSASAVGYWQFIRGTGKRYGLEISHYIDDRQDPELATHAAAKYLKALYNVFGSWHLALASYNTGENRVKRAVMKHYTRSYWDLIEKRALPRETRNYVGKFIAALRISRNPEKYGFKGLQYADPISFQLISVKHAVHLGKLSKKLGISFSKLRQYNSRYRMKIAPLRGGQVQLRIPHGFMGAAQTAVAASRWRGRTVRNIAGTYVVRRGDTLSGIAKKFRTSVKSLRNMNNLGAKSMIWAGQRLNVTRVGYKHNVAKLRRAKKKLNRIHIVRRGETLSTIARKYSISLRRLTAANRIRNNSRIFTGSQLVIPD